MKKESMRKYTLLGLVLIAASAVTAAVLPKNEIKKQVGGLENTNNGPGGQLTCSATPGGLGPCDYTATIAGGGGNPGEGSRTSSVNGVTVSSSITTEGGNNKVTTLTTAGDHTSHDQD